MGNSATIGPRVRAIVLETNLEEGFVSDPGKAERDAQVRGFRFYSGFSNLTDTSLHGNALILRRHHLMILPPVF